MKSILIFISLLIISMVGKSQDFPRYLIQNGDTVGVVFSIKQAQKIDNDLELLKLLNQYKKSSDSLQIYYVSVVNSYNTQIGLLNLKIKEMSGIDSTQKAMINNLKSQIFLYEKDLALLKTESDNKDKIIGNKDIIIGNQNQTISNKDSEIKKLKSQKVLGFGLGGGGILAALLILLLK